MFFMTFGTLLGAVASWADGDIMSWDYDVDVHVTMSNEKAWWKDSFRHWQLVAVDHQRPAEPKGEHQAQ